MGLMDSIKKRMSGEDADSESYDNDDYYGGFEDDYPSDDSQAQTASGAPQNNTTYPAGGVGGGMGMGMGMNSASGIGGISLSGAAIEMKVVKPEQFDSVPQIADHLLNKRTVVLNLENTNKETARRLIDFLSGVAYSIDGSLKKIASNAYVITPNNVDVGDAKLTRKAQPKQPEPEEDRDNSNDFGNY